MSAPVQDAHRFALSLGFDALDTLQAAMAVLGASDDLRAALAVIRDDLATELEGRWAGRPVAAHTAQACANDETSTERLLDRLWSAA